MGNDKQASSPSEKDAKTTAASKDNNGGGELSAAFRAETINIYNAPGSSAAPTSAPAAESASALPSVSCPYRGLETFEAEHAPNYFGRAAMVQKVLDKLQATNFVAVVGPSGSGKSSLVRAGLLTALRDNKLPGSRTWDIAILRPGEDPLRALAQSLVERLSSALTPVDRLTETSKLVDRLRHSTLPIGDVLAYLREQPPHPPHLLLIIDQFEEVFTVCADENIRRTFLAALLTAAETAWVTVLFTLRADFYSLVMEDEHFGPRADQGWVNILPMNEAERRAVIEQPALHAGRRFEEGLVQRILDAAATGPGALPFLEFALTELWKRQTTDGLLTHAAYEAIGELNGSIAQHANDILKSFNATEQVGVGKVFTRLELVQIDAGAEDTKRRVNLNEFDAAHQVLVRKLADARLLVTGHDASTGEETVEVAHEAVTNAALDFYSCFISYSSKDQAFAERLYTDLKAKGVRCWYAPHDIQGGKKIHEQIDQAIRVYDKLLVILSEHSMNSEWVKTEIYNARQQEAKENKRKLFPLSLVEYDQVRQWRAFDADIGKDMAREVREYYIPDFTHWKDHDAYQQAFERLLRDLKAQG